MAECLLIVLGFIEHAGQVLLTRRPAGVPQGGHWEFPGGKVETGERFSDALKRELMEEIAVEVTVAEEIAVAQYRYPTYCVELHLFQCELQSGEPTPRQVDAIHWAPIAELNRYDFPPANAVLLARIADVTGASVPIEGALECPKE